MSHAPNPHAGRPEQAPDPATNYERAKPQAEAGAGKLTSPVGRATPTDHHDPVDHGVSHTQPGNRQLNGQDDAAQAGATANIAGHPTHRQPTDLDAARDVLPKPEAVDHTMFDEEPMGADERPIEATNAEQRRQPRTEGKGGTR